MDKQNVLEYLKKQSRPKVLGDIAKALGLDHAEAARHLQALSRENQAFRSIRDGHAYYSANPADGEGAIPTQQFIGSIQKAVQATLGNAGVNAQTVQDNSATDVLLSLLNNAMGQDGDLPAESPVNWTFNKGLKFENEQFSVPIPDGFKIIAYEDRAFAAVPEDFGIIDGADEPDSSEAEVLILDGKLLGGAIEDPVLADPEIYHALLGNMGYLSAEKMRNMETGPMAALTNDVRLKLDGIYAVVSAQTGTGYSHMVWQMTCDGIKMLRVQTQHTPRAEVEREMNALLEWIAGLQWKHVMKRYPLNYSKLTQNSSTWLEAVQKKIVQLATYRKMSLSNEVQRREGNFASAEEFRIAMQGVADEMAPVFARVFEEIARAIPKVNGLDTKKARELVDQIRGFYPIRIDSDATETVMIEASAEIRKNFSEMDSALKEIEEKEKATREAEKLARAEERARREAEERKKKKALRQAAEADAKRRSALEDADRAQYDAFMAQYNQTRQACEEEEKTLSQRLENRRQELASLGFFKIAAKKEARADIERMEADQRALPGQQKEKLAGLWKALTTDQIQTILRHLAMQVLTSRDNGQREDVQKFAESSLQDFQITLNQIANAIEQLIKRGQIVELTGNGAPKLRAVKNGETAEFILEAERRRVEEERKREEARKAEEKRQRKEDSALIGDIMTVLVDGDSHSISEILSAVNSFRRQYKRQECSFADVQRALGWMKQDGQVKFGRAPYATRNRVGYYMA